MKTVKAFFITGLLAIQISAIAQTPFDDFADNTKDIPILELKDDYSKFKIPNPDTTGQIKYINFDVENLTLSYYGQNDSLVNQVALKPTQSKWWSVDPLADSSVGYSPFHFSGNNPILFIDPDGRDWVLYTGQKVIWYGGDYGDKSEVRYTFKGTSGMPGYRQAQYQGVKNAGPTPEGKYSINLKPALRVAKADPNTGELVSNPEGGIESIPETFTTRNGEIYTYPGWGTIRAKLDPDPQTNTQGRYAFYLHDSQKGYTHGCVECEQDFFDILLDYQKENNLIEVQVDYETPATSTYGGTDQ
jgi:hypothetical protein